MGSRRIAVPVLFLTLAAFMPTASHALEVTFSASADGASFTAIETLQGTATVNLDSNSPIGSAKLYQTAAGTAFTIARCTRCGGRARVFVSDGASIDRLILTDAQITNVGTSTATLRIRVESGDLTVAGPANYYPYATELSGLFQLSDPQNINRIKLKSLACYEGAESCELVDNPAFDPGETTNSRLYSVVAPPYKPAGTTQFSPKEAQNLWCGGFTEESEGQVCDPFLEMQLDVTLKPGHSARLPGSAGVHLVKQPCVPEDPTQQEGCEIMADLFASLGPKGEKVHETHLEPSPGSGVAIYFRDTNVVNSLDAWVTKRGGRGDDDDHNDDQSAAGTSASETTARLESNGAGEVRAKGLCPAAGCPASNQVAVRVYCSLQENPTFVTVLNLNSKGDGRAGLITSLPCPDPAVLIMHPDDPEDFWIAAPVVF